MSRLSGKVAVITGASQGMGASHARCFVAQGAKVILGDVNEEDGAKLASELGQNALFVKQDVTRKADWDAIIELGKERFGNINVLVNNAGIIGALASTVDLTEQEYQRICGVNQTAVFLGMQAVIPGMLQIGGGSIVNISSVAGMVAIYGSPNVAYVASKFAVRGMTKQVAVEYGERNIRVNSVHPGYIKTPMMAAATDENGGEAVKQIPLKRMAESSEVSNLVIFLASDESSFITGTEHVIDGGMTAL
ncbi:MAG: 3-oxoacyl-ACP reductase [Gammaproteobacteria bacterium]|nr:3-oxoacyl-ACP reductase [Gammaproteobacteria bacterium]